MTKSEREQALISAKKEQLLEAVQSHVLTHADLEAELARKETPYTIALRETLTILQPQQ